MIPQFNKEDLAWAAGFFEGEGHIGYSQLRKSKKYIELRALVVQCNKEPLERFRDIIGFGSVKPKKIYGNVSKKPQYEWRIYSYEKIQYLMCLMWNHLSSEKKQKFVDVFSARKDTWT